MIPQSDSSQSSVDIASKNKVHSYLDQDKIQKFYQSAQRLKIFVSQTAKLSLQQNQQLKKHLAKFQIPENQKRNIFVQDGEIVCLALQRIQRMIKSQKPKKNWTIDDRTILDWVVVHYALMKNYKNVEKQFAKQDWSYVASLIPGTNPNSCMFKWLSLHKTNLNQANWNEQESELLKTLVAKYVSANKSIQWKYVCKKLYLLNQNSRKNYRTQKQCKEHWICKLNPNIKRQPWTQQEDILLLQTIKQNSGLKKWVQMVKLFHGRTENAVKNRYNLIIQKQRKSIQRQKDQLELIDNYLQKCYVEKFTRILEPDSQQKKQQQQKPIKKKHPKKKKNKELDQQIILSLQPSLNGIGKQPIQIVDTQSSSLAKIQKNSVIENPNQKMNNNTRPIEQFLSIQNLSDIGKFNHRANDIQYDFIHMDSSMLN